jgi:hypothetical protein
MGGGVTLQLQSGGLRFKLSPQNGNSEAFYSCFVSTYTSG